MKLNLLLILLYSKISMLSSFPYWSFYNLWNTSPDKLSNILIPNTLKYLCIVFAFAVERCTDLYFVIGDPWRLGTGFPASFVQVVNSTFNSETLLIELVFQNRSSCYPSGYRCSKNGLFTKKICIQVQFTSPENQENFLQYP